MSPFGRGVRLGLIGHGTVGSGVVHLLNLNRETIARKLGRELQLHCVASRSLDIRTPPSGCSNVALLTDPWKVVRDPVVDVVVELIGGVEPARSLLLEAFANGKDVVTANKALLAVHGEEIFDAAENCGVRLGFEGSVSGGIPIVRTLREGLASDCNTALLGIVNGTCNYILSEMDTRAEEFRPVLRRAQDQGLAEADPSLDIDGIDTAHKLTLLATLAFGVRVSYESVFTEGIRKLCQTDISFAREFGYAIKLLAIAKEQNGALDLRVHPTMIPRGSLLANVGGAYNAIFVRGEALGASLYYGLGAGGLPTATAVLADVIDLARTRGESHASCPPPLGLRWRDLRVVPVRSIDDLASEYYLRVMVVDRPGVLAKIAGILGEHDISIAAVIQRGRSSGDETIPLVMRTHTAVERSMRTALDRVDRLPVVRGESVSVRIEENFSP